jgi:hypothetical protein
LAPASAYLAGLAREEHEVRQPPANRFPDLALMLRLALSRTESQQRQPMNDQAEFTAAVSTPPHDDSWPSSTLSKLNVRLVMIRPAGRRGWSSIAMRMCTVLLARAKKLTVRATDRDPEQQ